MQVCLFSFIRTQISYLAAVPNQGNLSSTAQVKAPSIWRLIAVGVSVRNYRIRSALSPKMIGCEARLFDLNTHAHAYSSKLLICARARTNGSNMMANRRESSAVVSARNVCIGAYCRRRIRLLATTTAIVTHAIEGNCDAIKCDACSNAQSLEIQGRDHYIYI